MNNYQFNWYIELTNSTFTFWVSKITLAENNIIKLVTSYPTAPVEVDVEGKTKPEELWALAKAALMDQA